MCHVLFLGESTMVIQVDAVHSIPEEKKCNNYVTLSIYLEGCDANMPGLCGIPKHLAELGTKILKLNVCILRLHLSQCMRSPTIWYVRPGKPQISLRIRAV